MERRAFLRSAGCLVCLAVLFSFTGCPPPPDSEENSFLVGVWKIDHVIFCNSMLPQLRHYVVAFHNDGTAEIVTDVHAMGTWSIPFSTNDISMSFPSINLGFFGTISGGTMSGVQGSDCWDATKVEF